MSADQETVVITREELERLRKLEADLPALLEKAKLERDKENLDRLHQRDKENPKEACARAMKRYNLKKDEINAKRREAYRLKKSAAPAGASFPAENNSPSNS